MVCTVYTWANEGIAPHIHNLALDEVAGGQLHTHTHAHAHAHAIPILIR